MLAKEGKSPDLFIVLQIMRCYLHLGDIDHGVQTFEDYMKSGKPPVVELYTTLVEGAMIGYAPKGMKIAEETLVNMNSRSFSLSPKMGSDLLLQAAGDEKREIPEDDPRLQHVTRTYNDLRARRGPGRAIR
ncbi:hypothetical protein ACFX1R_047024 [Malus domestica]